MTNVWDKRMTKGVFDAVNKNSCVMVTAGGGDFDYQRQVLENSFGKPHLLYKFPRPSGCDK